jgi:hypothetical protein
MAMPNIEDQVTAFYRGKQEVVFDFLGEDISSDGGLLLLRKVAHKTHIIRDISRLIPDRRSPFHVKYSYQHLLSQRVFRWRRATRTAMTPPACATTL